MSESDIQREILAYLKVIRMYHWRNNTGRRGTVSYGFPGSADIIGILPTGHFFGIECKGEHGKQSDKQREFELNINANNGLYILAYSLQDLKKGLAEWEKANSKPKGE